VWLAIQCVIGSLQDRLRTTSAEYTSPCDNNIIRNLWRNLYNVYFFKLLHEKIKRQCCQLRWTATYVSSRKQQNQINTQDIIQTRSTGRVHTSAKACLTSIWIWIQIRIPDPDHHQNLIICSLAHCQPSLKISCKSVQRFLCKVANGQTDRQTMMKSYPPWWR